MTNKDKLREILFDKFGFTDVDLRQKNWRAERLVECVPDIVALIIESLGEEKYVESGNKATSLEDSYIMGKNQHLNEVKRGWE